MDSEDIKVKRLGGGDTDFDSSDFGIFMDWLYVAKNQGGLSITHDLETAYQALLEVHSYIWSGEDEEEVEQA